MSLLLAHASTQYVLNSAPLITTVPFTVAAWVNSNNISTAAAGTLFALATSANNTNYWSIYHDGASGMVIEADATTVATSAVLSNTENAWIFVVGRFISSTNRRLTIFQSGSGNILNGQNTTSKAPAGTINRMAVGATVGSSAASSWNGMIAEFWCTNTDIQADGGQLDNTFLSQLAFGGPFSVPHVASAVVEYRSFRVHPSLNDPYETYSDYGGQTWTNNGAATTGPHPPLPYWYVKPGQNNKVLTI